jgi:hypothetical protein
MKLPRRDEALSTSSMMCSSMARLSAGMSGRASICWAMPMMMPSGFLVSWASPAAARPSSSRWALRMRSAASSSARMRRRMPAIQTAVTARMQTRAEAKMGAWRCQNQDEAKFSAVAAKAQVHDRVAARPQAKAQVGRFKGLGPAGGDLGGLQGAHMTYMSSVSISPLVLLVIRNSGMVPVWTRRPWRPWTTTKRVREPRMTLESTVSTCFQSVSSPLLMEAMTAFRVAKLSWARCRRQSSERSEYPCQDQKIQTPRARTRPMAVKSGMRYRRGVVFMFPPCRLVT